MNHVFLELDFQNQVVPKHLSFGVRYPKMYTQLQYIMKLTLSFSISDAETDLGFLSGSSGIIINLTFINIIIIIIIIIAILIIIGITMITMMMIIFGMMRRNEISCFV